MGSDRSEFFGAEHGHDQVDQAGQGEETDENCFHGSGARRSPDPVAEFRVGHGEAKKGRGEEDEKEVAHDGTAFVGGDSS
jgi:hypothetical protein